LSYKTYHVEEYLGENILRKPKILASEMGKFNYTNSVIYNSICNSVLQRLLSMLLILLQYVTEVGKYRLWHVIEQYYNPDYTSCHGFLKGSLFLWNAIFLFSFHTDLKILISWNSFSFFICYIDGLSLLLLLCWQLV
jgi:hypothetical protein